MKKAYGFIYLTNSIILTIGAGEELHVLKMHTPSGLQRILGVVSYIWAFPMPNQHVLFESASE